MRGEVRRAVPTKRSDVEIVGQREMFGRRQTYLKNPNFRSDGSKNVQILTNSHCTRFVCTAIRHVKIIYDWLNG